MGNNKILIAGLVGGIVSFIAGYLIWGLALKGFAEANAGAVIANRANEDFQFWAIILGSLASGFLIAMIYGKWATISTLKTGAINGGIIGLLLGISSSFIMYGTTELLTMPLVIVNTIGYGVLYAIIGGVVGLMLGRDVPVMAETGA